MISVSHLSRRFGSFQALDDISFEVARGDVVGFLGPNGAGKTTTLRILAGYLPATSGAAHVAGFDVLRQSMEVRQRIGYLPESVALYREHRVHEMLEFQARLHGLSRVDARTRIPRVLERVGVLDRSRDLIGNLSRGLRQRVGLAVALLPDPEVLILDEPTSGLDPLQRIEVRALIRDLAAQHTVILSSHILPEIEAVCPRVIILHRGRIAADGTPDELVKQLGHTSHVRVEAVVGADVAGALRMLAALPGVRGVTDRGRLGVHHQFELACDEDLREDAGALAASRGWALRELSWRRPTLEEIFARITLGFVEPATSSVRDTTTPGGARITTLVTPSLPAGAAPDSPSDASFAVPMVVHGAPAEPTKKLVYNLNPFDMGASRDLGRPKATDSPPRVELTRPPTVASDGERTSPSDPGDGSRTGACDSR